MFQRLHSKIPGVVCKSYLASPNFGKSSLRILIYCVKTPLFARFYPVIRHNSTFDLGIGKTRISTETVRAPNLIPLQS